MTLVHAFHNLYRVSIEDALIGITRESESDIDARSLGKFLAMTDSIVSLILNSSSKSQKMIKV